MTWSLAAGKGLLQYGTIRGGFSEEVPLELEPGMYWI